METADVMIAGAGTLIGAFSTFFFQKKQENRSDFSTLITSHKDLYEQVKQLYAETQVREDKCEEELRKIRLEFINLQSEVWTLKSRLNQS
jgi:hypothetical protein